MWPRSGSNNRLVRLAALGRTRWGWLPWLPIIPAVTLALLLTQGALAPSAAYADPAQIGQWTAPFNIGLVGIHSQVLPNGQVLLYQYPTVAGTGTRAILLDPSTQTYTNVSMSYQRDAFCGGENLLPNGTVFASGGHQYNNSNPASHEDGLGAPQNDLFDPTTNTWTPAPQLDVGRWYPTNVELGNGHVLIFGGQLSPTTKATTVDEYDPSANTISVLPSTANKSLPVYPRMTLLPNGKILNSEPNAGTYLFNPATSSWSWLGHTALDTARTEGSTVLLPGLNKVLIAGGKNGTTGATNTAETIDFSQAKPTWHFTGSMTYARAYSNAVLLADGTVLEVGGGQAGAYSSPILTPELYDPTAGTWSTMAPQTAPRIYHSTAVLLPSGQVLSAGMDSGPYQDTAEIYSPPYLFKGARPTISSAPSSVTYGQQFTISTPDASSITRVALVKPAGTTHAEGQDQRYVDLTFSQADSGDLTATAPADGNHAPPGWYMLFILNSSGVPSVASWVQVG